MGRRERTYGLPKVAFTSRHVRGRPCAAPAREHPRPVHLPLLRLFVAREDGLREKALAGDVAVYDVAVLNSVVVG